MIREEIGESLPGREGLMKTLTVSSDGTASESLLVFLSQTVDKDVEYIGNNHSREKSNFQLLVSYTLDSLTHLWMRKILAGQHNGCMEIFDDIN